MQHVPVYTRSSSAAEWRLRGRRHTPLGVVLIALYGLACAILLGYGLWQGWQFDQFHPDLGQEQLRSHANDILFVVPVSIVIHVLISAGLLMRMQAARFGRIVLSAVNLVVYYEYRSFFFQEVPPQIDLAGQTITAILMADGLILCYLAFMPVANEAFRARD